MYGPPRFCKDDVAGFAVGANVSGLSGEAQLMPRAAMEMRASPAW
jgi:hypothetical protein